MHGIKRLGALALLALAGHDAAAESIEMEVHGLVCAFCAQGIEKTLRGFDATEDVLVSLEHRTVAIELRDGASLGDAELRDAMTDAGYTVVGIERSDEPLASIEARIRARDR